MVETDCPEYVGRELGVLMSAKWDHRFLDLATHIASWSKDPSTKVGCVVVGSDREIRSTGFGGSPAVSMTTMIA